MAKAGYARALRVGAFMIGLAILAGGFGTPPGRADDKKAADTGGEAIKDELLKLNEIKDEDARRKKLRAFVKDKEQAKKAVAVAAKMMKSADKEKPFKFEAAMLLGQAAHYLKDYTTAKLFYDHCAAAATKVESAEKMTQAYEGMVDMYFDSKKYQQAVDLVEKVVELMGPEEFEAVKPFFLERLIQAKAKLGKTDEALRITEGLIQLDDGGWYFVRTKGWVLREAGKLDAAIEAYLEALDKLEANKRIKGEPKNRAKDSLRYSLTGLYVDNKEVDKAAKQLQTLIKRDPENPTYKNDLGFIWADHDMNLEESEKLVREALDLDQKRQQKAKEDGKLDTVEENAAYLDSLGWVLFKQKKYKEALPYLKKASADEDEGNHLEIWDHLADVYMALGQKKDAIDAWQKGLEMEDVSPRDIERRTKVIAKLKAEGVEPKVIPKKKEKIID